ncbi:hypothetical protein Slin15195_G032080 [Septoria linicola]|uniref:Uncharacterized protein n=1 Tax=Septoria linicola TaxID=215465 RepID=A0A9Q9EHD5_9PEZI|nr:hypothetical protein Slin14017_G031100 [Septoria linicola]USW49889.1 hypothetical protein Slin15195_G032080 [Septoria linicola]
MAYYQRFEKGNENQRNTYRSGMGSKCTEMMAILDQLNALELEWVRLYAGLRLQTRSKEFKFLALPAELRNRVYYFVAIASLKRDEPHHHRRLDAILGINRQIRREMTQVLYEGSVIRFWQIKGRAGNGSRRWTEAHLPRLLHDILTGTRAIDPIHTWKWCQRQLKMHHIYGGELAIIVDAAGLGERSFDILFFDPSQVGKYGQPGENEA